MFYNFYIILQSKLSELKSYYAQNGKYIENIWVDDNRGKWAIIGEFGTYFATFYKFI